MDHGKFELLYSAYQEAQGAVNAHFQTLKRAIGYDDATMEWHGERLLDREWLDVHKKLWDERDEAHQRLTRYLQGEEV